MLLTGLRVNQVGLQRSRVEPEKRVGQGAVPPEEAGQVQPDQQFHQGIEQPVGRLAAPGIGEQRPVSGRVVEEAGDQDRVHVLAAVHHDAHDVDGRDAGLGQAAQQPVFTPGEVLVDRFQREQLTVLFDEPHDMPGDPAHPDLDHPLVPPVFQRLGPRQGEESCCLVGGRAEDEPHGSVRLLREFSSARTLVPPA